MKKLAPIFLLFTLGCNVSQQKFSGSKSIDLNNAFKTALGMSLISMISMEAAMNLTDFLLNKIIYHLMVILLEYPTIKCG